MVMDFVDADGDGYMDADEARQLVSTMSGIPLALVASDHDTGIPLALVHGIRS